MEQTTERQARVLQQCRAWAEKLTDLSRRNRLLFYRVLKKGTLVLRPDEERLAALLSGEKLMVSDLLPKETSPDEAFARSREIARTALSNREERGLSTLFLAIDHVFWLSSDDHREVTTPLALVPVSLEHSGSSSHRATIGAAGSLMVNPILAYSWQQAFGIAPPGENGEVDDVEKLAALRSWHRRATSLLAASKRQPALTIDNFSFQKMAMVEELSDPCQTLLSNDVIAALAGVRDAIQPASEADVTLEELEQQSPDNEFLVLDADSSQQRVVESVLRGRSGVIHGPPGTGKSQTIANLISSLAAQGKRVLFVAEKRAALDVVKGRLADVGLGHLVLDLHGADVSRKAIASQIAKAFDQVTTAPMPEVSDTHRRYERARRELASRAEALHAKRSSIGMSVYQALGEVLRCKPPQTRFRGKALERLSLERAQDLERQLTKAAAYASIVLGTDPSPWLQASEVNEEVLLPAVDEVSRLEALLIDIEAKLLQTVSAWGPRSPLTLAWIRRVVSAIREVDLITGRYRYRLPRQERHSLLATLAPVEHGGRAALWALMTNDAFRKARRVLRKARIGRETMRAMVREVRVVTRAEEMFDSLCSAQLPPYGSEVRQVEDVAGRLEAAIAALAPILPLDWKNIAWSEMRELVGQLLRDQPLAVKLPAGRRLRTSLIGEGLEHFLAEMKRCAGPPMEWPSLFRSAWLVSWVEQFSLHEPPLHLTDRNLLDRTAQEFRVADQRRVEASSSRVRRLHAKHAIETFNSHPAEHQRLKKEAAKKARHVSFRSLITEAPHALSALCPCIMASPLSVSHLIPAEEESFDVVIVDEASQVQPEDAAPALARAPQVVVAGDPKQLPPTSFFASETEKDEAEDALTGLESVLDALLTVFPSWKLSWHYRSRDERLIAYSNRTIYNDSLITFPGINREEPVLFEAIAFEPRDGQEDSSSEEVRRVVERVLEHARERPDVSLGVITMGIKHRDRVQHALDEALASAPEVSAFFDLHKKERFFIKNIEQVQGDERDEIFLSIGYAKSADGRLLYRFGPILGEGGERRLNVATTRAKRRMRVFCAFSHLDLDPKRSSSEGLRYLRGFLQFAASGGRILGDEGRVAVELNPFEEDVRLALESRGLAVVPQLGVSGYRIDFAVQHPDQPGRFILAIECDGASYHSAAMTRDRDRLRQQQLEALGWCVYRIWSTDWFHHRAEELDRVVGKVESILAEGQANMEERHRSSARASVRAQPLSRGEKPWIPAQSKIASVPQHVIHRIIRWVESDGVLRTNEELIAEVAREMGFKRLGSRIREKIAASVLEKN